MKDLTIRFDVSREYVPWKPTEIAKDWAHGKCQKRLVDVRKVDMGEYVCSIGVKLVEGASNRGVLQKLVSYELSRHVEIRVVCA